MTSTRTPVYDDPLAALPIRPDGAITRELGDDGRWHRVRGVKVPALRGVKGKWLGYTPEDDWQSSYGWPNDHEAFRQTVLYRADQVVGELWFYRFPSRPDLTVLFVYRSMATWTDSAGRHDGEHDFCWFGVIEGDLP